MAGSAARTRKDGCGWWQDGRACPAGRGPSARPSETATRGTRACAHTRPVPCGQHRHWPSCWARASHAWHKGSAGVLIRQVPPRLPPWDVFTAGDRVIWHARQPRRPQLSLVLDHRQGSHAVRSRAPAARSLIPPRAGPHQGKTTVRPILGEWDDRRSSARPAWPEGRGSGCCKSAIVAGPARPGWVVVGAVSGAPFLIAVAELPGHGPRCVNTESRSW